MAMSSIKGLAAEPAPSVGFGSRVSIATSLAQKIARGEPLTDLEKEIGSTPAVRRDLHRSMTRLTHKVKSLEKAALKEENRARFLRHVIDRVTPKCFFGAPVSSMGLQRLKRLAVSCEGATEGHRFARTAALHWFDFRGIIDHGEPLIDDAIRGVEAGALRLPFDECVFVFNMLSSSGHVGTKCLHLRNSENSVDMVGLAAVFDDGVAFCAEFDTGKKAPTPPADHEDLPIAEELSRVPYAALALLSSASIERTSRTAKGLVVEGPLTNRQPLYSVLRMMRQSQQHGASMGERNAPRMHWRRGHVRRYKTGDTVWIAPILVGNMRNGLLIKDYA